MKTTTKLYDFIDTLSECLVVIDKRIFKDRKMTPEYQWALPGLIEIERMKTDAQKKLNILNKKIIRKTNRFINSFN